MLTLGIYARFNGVYTVLYAIFIFAKISGNINFKFPLIFITN